MPKEQVYDVTGSLCDNSDKFAIDRPLPTVDVGDLAMIPETSAHGHSMGFNYNGKLRRVEPVDDYFATLDYPGLVN